MAPTIEHYNPEFGCTIGNDNLSPKERYYGTSIRGAHYVVSEQDMIDGKELGRTLVPKTAYQVISENEENSTAEVTEVPETMLRSIAISLKNREPGLANRLRFLHRRQFRPTVLFQDF